MTMRAILLALRQLAHPATLWLAAKVAVITLALFALLGTGLYQLLNRIILPRWLERQDSDTALGVAILITFLLGWFLFRAVAMAVMGLFSDAVVASVEEDHYPDAAAQARPVSFARGLAIGLRSARRAIGWNLLASPAYILLLPTGIGTPALVLIVNAMLLSRDLETMVAARHPVGLTPLTRMERWTLGLASAGMFLIPFVNLLAPVFGAALAVHLHHIHERKSA